ncbi:MAG: 5'/3'-nucleotidase SurE [Clostridia bacterium]|nr:5'/3'-nucleotidase SurE [Clostridia bacterium]
MRILISNDDGIFAPGIAALIRACADAGHEIYVCAPDGQRSAASHSLTLRHALTVREMEIPGAVRAWAIGGTPVDCVKLGLLMLCPQAEFVISGVNHGYNAGTDILYSGTVGAAMEGVINGRPAIAVSLAASREDTYDKAAALAVGMLDRLMQHPLKPDTLLNLNYPAVDEALGVVAAPMKRIRYDEEYVKTVGEDGTVCYALGGAIAPEQEETDGDYAWLQRGYATATVLSFDLADKEATESIKNWL